MLTIKAEIKKSELKVDGTYNVKIRFTLDRKVKRLSTNLFITSKDLTKSLKFKEDTSIKRAIDGLVWRLLCILRYTIQGVGYTNLAMLSGVLEMIARILVSLLAVPAFGCLAVCFGDPTAWIFADAFLIPAFIYVYRRILRMKKN